MATAKPKIPMGSDLAPLIVAASRQGRNEDAPALMLADKLRELNNPTYQIIQRDIQQPLGQVSWGNADPFVRGRRPGVQHFWRDRVSSRPNESTAIQTGLKVVHFTPNDFTTPVPNMPCLTL